ncbi:heme-copper oxidase subunit III [Chloroflexota bacterium]
MSSERITNSDRHAPAHEHEEIHLPSPSWGPIVLGLGATVLASGLAFIRNRDVVDSFAIYPPGLLLFLVGLVIFLVGVWKVSNFDFIENTQSSMNVDSRVLGMWIFLASEIMFFAGLIATFLGYKARAGEVVSLLNVPLMTVATFVLLTSSFTAVSALSAIQEGRMKAFRNWLIATMALGVVFLGLEITEWIELWGHGVTQQTLFGSAFFTLTGFHGFHVIIGLVWIGFLLLRYFQGRMSTADATGVELFGLYWHFVDIIWIVLFTIVYLL